MSLDNALPTVLRDAERVIAEARGLNDKFDLGLDGPGPFERCENRVLAAAVREIDMHGHSDHALVDEAFGLYGTQVGCFILLTNEQNFHELTICNSPEAAHLLLVRLLG